MLTVSDNGIEVPEKYQSSKSIVIRTFDSTINISSGFSSMVTDDGFFPLITASSFSNTSDQSKNPELEQNEISFKDYGSDPEIFVIDL